jgi:alpha,alpha-trehalose phosphorylase
MIRHPDFPTEPWRLRATELRLEWLAQTESVFALADGHIGLRGNLDEGEPFGLPSGYLGGFYEVRPLPYPETAYAYPETGRSVVNVTNGKVIRLLVEDEPFDVRDGELRSHERALPPLRRLAAGHRRRSPQMSSAPLPARRLPQTMSPPRPLPDTIRRTRSRAYRPIAFACCDRADRGRPSDKRARWEIR